MKVQCPDCKNYLKKIKLLKKELEIARSGRKKLEITLNDSLSENIKIQQTDSLTGLFNTYGLCIAGTKAMETAMQTEVLFAVVFFDLDNFGLINKVIDYEVGDEIIKKAAKILQNAVRRVTDIIGRRGGDEFVIVFTDTNFEYIISIVKTIKDLFRQISSPHPSIPHIEVSVGIHITEISKQNKLDFFYFCKIAAENMKKDKAKKKCK